MEPNTLLMPFKIEKLSVPKKVKYFKSGNWSQKQRLRFTIFLDHNKHLFAEGLNKKSVKIFLVMSRFVKTRTPAQCRSHHQKAQRHYKNIQNIVSIQIDKVGDKFYRMMSEIYEAQLKQINRSTYDICLQQSFLNKKTSGSQQKSEIIRSISQMSLDVSQQIINGPIQNVQEKYMEYQYQYQQHHANLFEFPITQYKHTEVGEPFNFYPIWNMQEQKAYFHPSICSNSTQGSLHNDQECDGKIRLIQRCNYHFYQWMHAVLELEKWTVVEKRHYFN